MKKIIKIKKRIAILNELEKDFKFIPANLTNLMKRKEFQHN